jgi:DNA-binding SARP family transcriptional activator/tetratricopeptide (TPR) repeat protein
VQFRLLGPLEVRTNDGRPARLGAAKHRAMLAVLLMSANRTVSTDRLIDALWPADPPPSTRGALRTYAWALRRELGLGRAGVATTLVGDHGGYRIDLDPAELDLLVFEQLAADGQRALTDGDPAAAAERLQHALALWRGPPLEDVPLDGGFATELAWLTELRHRVVEAGAEARLALGQHTELVPELSGLSAAHPVRERLHALLLTALYRSGRQADALAHYRELRERLVEELGIEPGRQLQRLHRQMLTASPDLDPPPPPVGRSGTVHFVPLQLPADISAFIGRRPELERLARLLRPGRAPGTVPICAIDGIGGIGKSALAVHAAHRFADRYPDGQLYTDLRGAMAGSAPVAPQAVLERFLRALDVPTAGCISLAEAAAMFRAATAARRVLVVLDNARDAAQIQPLLPAGAGCAVLVTSRQILAGVDGAAHLHLDVLSEEDAATLLNQVAGVRSPASESAATGTVAGDPQAARTVARLCGYLPLAVRIAGGRLAARPGWPVRALADRLSNAQRRLDELQLGDLGVRASFQVSLQALAESPDPMDRLAADTFPLVAEPDGPDVSLDLAARLCDQPAMVAEAVLERLVDGQLLESPVPHRYRMHDLLRLFARDLPVDRARRTEALVRGLRWYTATAQQTAGPLRPQAPPAASGGRFTTAAAALAWLEAERANLVAAAHQAAATPGVSPEIVIDLAQALYGLFERRGYRQDWIELNNAALAVARRSGDLAAEAYAYRDLGVGYERQGRYHEAMACLDQSLTLFRRLDDPEGQARSLASIGVIHHNQGRYPQALDCHRQALVLRRQVGDRNGEARSLNNLGVTYGRQQRHAQARRCYQDALSILDELGDSRIRAAVLTNLGDVHERQREYEQARACQERSLALFRELDDRDGQVASLNNLGRVRRHLGQHRAALAAHREALSICLPLGERLSQAECLREIGTNLHALGQPRAGEYWRRALAIFEALDVPEAAEVKALLAAA